MARALSRLSIGQKLAAAFGLVVLLVGTVGAVSLDRLSTLDAAAPTRHPRRR